MGTWERAATTRHQRRGKGAVGPDAEMGKIYAHGDGVVWGQDGYGGWCRYVFRVFVCGLSVAEMRACSAWDDVMCTKRIWHIGLPRPAFRSISCVHGLCAHAPDFLPFSFTETDTDHIPSHQVLALVPSFL